jgi:surface-anchored protein
VYLLPQVQDPDLVWPGWSTERLSAGQVVGDQVQLRLSAVEGPGDLKVFTTDQFGAPSVLFDSAAGFQNGIPVPIRTHAHANWAFTEPGVHRVDIEVSGSVVGAGPTTTTATYVVLVGDAQAPVPPDSVPPPRSTTPDGAPGSGGDPGAAASASGADGPGVSDGQSGSSRSDAARGAGSGGSTGNGALASTGVGTAGPLVLALSLVFVGAATLGARRRLAPGSR